MGYSLFVIEILAIAVIVVGLIAAVIFKGTGFASPLSPPVETLPPVLLPEDPDHIDTEDIQKLRFSLALRGYRTDQVDEVLERLSETISTQKAEIHRLRQHLKNGRRHGVSSGALSDPE